MKKLSLFSYLKVVIIWLFRFILLACSFFVFFGYIFYWKLAIIYFSIIIIFLLYKKFANYKVKIISSSLFWKLFYPTMLFGFTLFISFRHTFLPIQCRGIQDNLKYFKSYYIKPGSFYDVVKSPLEKVIFATDNESHTIYKIQMKDRDLSNFVYKISLYKGSSVRFGEIYKGMYFPVRLRIYKPKNKLIVSIQNYNKHTSGKLFFIPLLRFSKANAKIYNYPCKADSDMIVNEKGKELFISCDFAGYTLLCIDLNTMRVKRTMRLKQLSMEKNLFFDEKSELIYMTNGFGKLFIINAKTFNIVKSKWIGLTAFGVVVDDNRIYITRPLLSKVTVLDKKRLNVIEEIKAGYGARKLVIDKIHNLLFIGNYVDGTLDIVDKKNGNRLKRINLGKLVRCMYFDEDSSSLFIASGCGIFQLDTDHIIKDFQ